MIDLFCTNGSSPPQTRVRRRSPDLVVAQSPPADVLVRYNAGDTVGLVVPVTAAADTWIDDHALDPLRIGRVLVVEHRYIGDLLVGMRRDGLALADL